MMLARVADSLYWTGRYVERAEHICRVCDVMLNATLDRAESAAEVARIGLAAIGMADDGRSPYQAARALVLERASGTVVSALAHARENARQVRDQITTETWERLNLLHLRMGQPAAAQAFDHGSSSFLRGVVEDLHLFRGAADATMSHGEGWRFLMLGAYLERAQLIARLLDVSFGNDGRGVGGHLAHMGLLRMACALEPYLRTYTADIRSGPILEFLLFDPDFPRSIRFCTEQIERQSTALTRSSGMGQTPARLAGRLNARLRFADIHEVETRGAGPLLSTVQSECAAIHQAVYDAFISYPLEARLPA